MPPSPMPVSDAPYLRSIVAMGTVVTIQIVGRPARNEDALRDEALERAFGWFRQVEAACTRFDEQSELMQLAARPGVPVPAGALLYEAVQFALAVAAESGGAFDPTVGCAQERRGFNRNYRTGRTIRTAIGSEAFADGVSYRDVLLDPERRTITLLRPLILDLGAVAKGLAIDLAARELRPFENFAINAGGDLYLGGRNLQGEPWSIGIRHPRRDDELIDSLRVSDSAVCTSGDYERPAPPGDGSHHILDPRTGASPLAAASATAVAPNAILADALATAAFVLGPREGLRLFERLGVEGLIVSSDLERFATRGLCSAIAC